MGIAKQLGILCDERGYDMDRSMVCSHCIGNNHLSQLAYKQGKCLSCGKAAKCITVEELCEAIMDGIDLEYEHADNRMGWEKGVFVGANTWDTYDLLDDLNGDMQLEEKVLDAVRSNIHDITWCEKDPYNLRWHKEQHYMWKAFCNMVKHETRYVFFRMPDQRSQNIYMEESPYLILDHIAEAADKLELFKTIKSGTQFFRGRGHEEPEFISKVSDLTSPPDNLASANRMSAEGISVFYGADSVDTALDEIATDALCYATLARFKSLRELNILDLTSIRQLEMPSLFDKEMGQYREEIEFLYTLEEDLTRSIKGEGKRKAIEYVPTQVIAEYFRYLYKIHGKPVDGVSYRSAENEKGTCYALFFNQRQCLSNPPYSYTQELKFVRGSIRHYKLSGRWECI